MGLLTSMTMMAQINNNDQANANSHVLIEKIIEVNKAQNKVMWKNSTEADVNALFDLYSDDFVYIHEVYGGTYTRSHLYNNTMKYLQSGGYTMTHDRYEIKQYIVGLDAVAVERKEHGGGLHLAVFEFKNDKIAKITEYWK